ncbi:MAG: LicD family protein [Oscillospiraceae bacterium]
MLRILKKVHEICTANNLTYFLSDGTLLGAVRHGGFIPWDDDLDIVMPREDYRRFTLIAQKELGDDFFLQTTKTDPDYKSWFIPMKVRDNNSTYIEKYGRSYHQGVYIDVFPIDIFTGKKQLKRKKIISLLSIIKGPIATFKPASVHYWARLLFQCLLRFIPNKLIIRYIKKAQRENDEIVKNNPDLKDYVYGFETPWSIRLNHEEIYPLKLVKFENLEAFAPNDTHSLLKKQYGDYMQIPPESERGVHLTYFSNERLFSLPIRRED